MNGHFGVNAPSLPITLPASFPLVGLGLSSLFCLQAWQTIKVVRARRAADVGYPTLYASEEAAKADPAKYKFNCIQRANQNTLEYVPYVGVLTLFLGVFQPVTAASLCTTWAVGKVFYTWNYSSGDPETIEDGLAKLSGAAIIGLVASTLYVSATKTYALYF